jgi:glucokinase
MRDMQSNKQLKNHICLVADIGGTNARFAIASMDDDSPNFAANEILYPQTIAVADHKNIEAAITAYIKQLPEEFKPTMASLAVASAVVDDQVNFTNSGWSFSTKQLQAKLNFDEVFVINDFAALAWGLPKIKPDELKVLNADIDKSSLLSGQENYVVLGPGTGLGVTAFRKRHGKTIVLDTEAGHISFAPETEHEIEMLQFLQKKYRRVSYERLLCGQGLINIYETQCHRLGQNFNCQHASEVVAKSQLGLEPAQVAIRMFCEVLGSFAGDSVLAYGAWSGVYLNGGLLGHVLNEQTEKLLLERYINKGRYSSLVKSTPIAQILKKDLGEVGAWQYAKQQQLE